MTDILIFDKLSSSYHYTANDGHVLILEPTGRYIVKDAGFGTFHVYEFDIIEPYMGDESETSNRLWLKLDEVYEIFEISNV